METENEDQWTVVNGDFETEMSQMWWCEMFALFVPQECGPLDSEAMVMSVLDQSFDVLVLRYRVQKRIYCKVGLC